MLLVSHIFYLEIFSDLPLLLYRRLINRNQFRFISILFYGYQSDQSYYPNLAYFICKYYSTFLIHPSYLIYNILHLYIYIYIYILLHHTLNSRVNK